MSDNFESEKFENFERAFDTYTGGCQGVCECGLEFYDCENRWDWEEGELERMQSDTKAKPLNYAVGYVHFEGRVYVMDCDCWKPRATVIIKFIENHAEEIAKYLTLEKKRKQKIADEAPTVSEP